MYGRKLDQKASFRRNGNKLDMINSMQIVGEVIYTKREINKDVASFCNHNKEIKKLALVTE